MQQEPHNAIPIVHFVIRPIVDLGSLETSFRNIPKVNTIAF